MPEKKVAKKKAVKKVVKKDVTKKTVAKVKNLGGRPSIYTEDLADEICAAISKDTDSLRQIVAKYPSFPAADTVNEWRYRYPGFNAKYRLAQSHQAELRMEEAHEISESRVHDFYVNKDGVEVPNPVAVARDRLRIDNRKYMVSKLAAAVYGDKMQNEITVIKHEDTIEALK